MPASRDDEVKSLLRQADVYHTASSYQNMLQVARRVLSLDPENKEGHLWVGRAHICLEEFAAALPHFEKALACDPETAKSYASYANRGGQYDDLAQFFEGDQG